MTAFDQVKFYSWHSQRLAKKILSAKQMILFRIREGRRKKVRRAFTRADKGCSCSVRFLWLRRRVGGGFQQFAQMGEIGVGQTGFDQSVEVFEDGLIPRFAVGLSGIHFLVAVGKI